MSSTKARTEVMLHRSAVGFRLQIVRQDDKRLEAGVPMQVDCTDSAAGEKRMLLQQTTA